MIGLTAALLFLVLAPTALAGKYPDTSFGSTGSGAGQFSNISGIAINRTGNDSTGAAGAAPGDLYVVNRGNNRIEQFSAGGAFVRAFGANVGGAGVNACTASCAAGTASNAAGGLNSPVGVAVNQANGLVYVTDQTNRRVDIFDASGKFQGAFGWGVDTGAAAFEFCTTASACQAPNTTLPTGGEAGKFGTSIGFPAVLPSGNLLVADRANQRIDEFSATVSGGVVTAVSFVRAFGWDVANTGDGGDTAPANQFEICTAICKQGVAGSGVGQFSLGQPFDIATDSSGAIYALESGGNLRVQKFTPAAGSLTPSVFAPAVLSAPNGATAPVNIAVDSSDHIYVAKAFEATATCPAERRILELDSSGAQLGVHLECAGINTVQGLAAESPAGRLYVTSIAGTQRVFILDADGAVPPTAILDPVTGVETHGATFSGSVNPTNTVFTTGYHFEYSTDGTAWTKIPLADVNVGNGSASVPAGPQAVTGLAANQTYHVRLAVTKEFNRTYYSAERTFTTPPAAPVVGAVTVSEPSPTSVRLTGSIRSENSPTTYRFEYGPDTSYGNAIPVPDGNAGSNPGPVSVSKVISGLQPGATYHARLVATNVVDTVAGPDLEFSTPSGAVPPPGERGYELVSPAGSGTYDVNPVYSSGQGGPLATSAQASSPDGSRTTFMLEQGGLLPGMAPDGEAPDYFIASRGSGGWSSTSPLSDRSGQSCHPTSGAPKFITMTADGSRELLYLVCKADKGWFSGANGEGAPLDQTSDGTSTLYGVDVASETRDFIGTAYGAAGPIVRTGSLTHDRFLGGSPDLSVTYFATPAALTPDAVAGANTNFILVYRRSGGSTSLLTKTAAGAAFQLNGTTTTLPDPLGKPGTVSADGEALTISVQGAVSGVDPADTNTVADVFQWRGDETVWVSKSERSPAATPANRFFEGADSSGRLVFFSSAEAMTGDDADTVADIYLADLSQPEGSRLSRVSIGDAGCGTCNDNASAAAVNNGNGTGSNGSAARFVTVSQDGSHVFFTSGDVLAAADVDNQQSLYVRDLDGARTFYVAPIGAGITSATNGTDAGSSSPGSLTQLLTLTASPFTRNFADRPIQLSPDGRTAAVSLVSRVDLPAGRGGPDADAASDLFVWREGDGLRRVRQGLEPDDSTTTVPALGCRNRSKQGGSRAACRPISADGTRVFFETEDRLVADDTDGGFTDVYELHPADGSVTLVSPPGDAPFQSNYVDSSASGDDVFFLTGETLDPSRDLDGARVDLYDARTGPVFPPLSSPSACSPLTAECLPPAGQPPAVPAPASAQATGSNLAVADCGPLTRRAKQLRRAVAAAWQRSRHASSPADARRLRARARVLERKRVRATARARRCWRVNG